jgi:hypothetical protein
MTAAQRLQITTALGKDCLAIAEQIVGEMEQSKSAPRWMWHRLLSLLHEHHQDVMETPLGALFTYAVLGRIQNATDDASERRRASRGAGPNRRQ